MPRSRSSSRPLRLSGKFCGAGECEVYKRTGGGRKGRLLRFRPPLRVIAAGQTSISMSLIDTSGSLPPSTRRPQSESLDPLPPLRSLSRWHSMQ